MAFSVGIFVGMSPLLGFHTVLGIFLAYMFRLNKFVTIVGVYVTNPWTIVPIYTFGTWIGARLLGINDIIPDIDWAHLSIKELLSTFRPLLLPFALGTTVLGLVSTILSYLFIFRLIKRNRD
jgi:uncharacterized protein